MTTEEAQAEYAMQQQATLENFIRFALDERPAEMAIVDIAPMIHTAMAPTRRPRSAAARLIMPGIVPETPLGDCGHLTLKVPGPIVDMIHGDPKERDVLLLVHIERDVLDSWLLRRKITEGVVS